MPVEIKELQIVTVVTGNGGTPNTGSAPASSDQDKMIAACVEQVLDILKRKNDR